MSAPASSEKLDILLVGCGKMGGAMAQGWLNANIVKSLTILDPAPLPDIFQDHKNIYHAAETKALEAQSWDCVMMAVKPQMMGDVCASLADTVTDKSVVVSIAAGTPISLFEKHFGDSQPVIRAMPNTPAAIGKGVTAAMPNAHVTGTQKDKAAAILSVSGDLKWVEDENLFHAITALSGSGPAYVFLLIETMAKAGTDIGLDENLARDLARQTVIGSAALAGHDADTGADQLRKNVTSPGGTTQAALDVLMDGRLEELFRSALSAAKARSEELAST